MKTCLVVLPFFIYLYSKPVQHAANIDQPPPTPPPHPTLTHPCGVEVKDGDIVCLQVR